MPQQIRRVVSGNDSSGRSIFMADGPAQTVKQMSAFAGLALTDLWVTNGAPASNAGNADAVADREVVLEPPTNGTVFRVVEFPPDAAWKGHGGAGADAFSTLGAGHAKDRGSADQMMHKTSTVDYLIVLRGEIWAVLEQGEVLLRTGDVMIQRGTNHSWSNRSAEPCLLAAILVSAAAA